MEEILRNSKKMCVERVCITILYIKEKSLESIERENIYSNKIVNKDIRDILKDNYNINSIYKYNYSDGFIEINNDNIMFDDDYEEFNYYSKLFVIAEYSGNKKRVKFTKKTFNKLGKLKTKKSV